MNKATIVADLAYVSTKARGRTSGYQHLRGKLKYLQYRDDRNEHLKQRDLRERWQDRGLGKTYRGILRSCDRLRSQHVLAWTWVISPAPDLMALVPEALRRDLLIDLTERIVESYYAARGLDTPEFAFVLHERTTNAREGQPGLQQLHTHVILPGTVPTLDGRASLYNNKERGHDRLFREIAAQHFETALGDIVGPRWRELRRDPELTPALPDSGDLEAWFPRERE